ncbi:MAG: riboflavin biosynthesis protein RibF [Actinobacteria bacterium]|nr:riboflavin biosynthesis protein RibF [Actinomycetota bacterium]
MEVLETLEQFSSSAKGGALCIGNFDGVHIGHQQLLAKTAELAKSVSAPAVVLTLHPHPMRILSPEKMPEPICRLEDKLAWLDRAGADIVVLEPATSQVLQLTPQQFVDRMVVKYIEPRWIVEGRSFRFGRGRAGDVNLLERLGRDRNFQLCVLPPVQADLGADGEFTVSSSLIRELLRAGLVAQAAHCLGRSHSITGLVGRGSGRGRTLGLPTANVDRIDQLTPAEGVYAGRAWSQDNKCYLAAISVGTAVTFDHGERLVEAILLDFDDDLYGQGIRLDFYQHLRRQRRFPSPAELADQIRTDCRTVRQLAADGRIDLPTEPAT